METVKNGCVILLLSKLIIHMVPDEIYVPYVQCVVDFTILFLFLRRFIEWFEAMGGLL